MDNKSSISHIKNEWFELIDNRNSKSIEFRRREASLIAMAFLGISALSVLIATNWSTYPDLLLNILIINNIGLISSIAFYAKTKNLIVSGLICITFACILDLMLIYSGGKENTALYWTMFFPLAAYSVLGLTLGTIFTGVMFLFAILLLYSFDIVAIYSAIEKSRYLMALLCISILCFINEYFRTREYYETSNMTLNYKKDANTDPLTRLPNRRFLESNYVKKVVECNETFIVIMADIDKFKMVNDTYGHEVGDLALKHCANIFGQKIRKSDLLCRYGGEEFLICLPNTNKEQAIVIAEKLRTSLKEASLTVCDKQTINFTCSFGIATLSNRTFEDGLKIADNRLYKAKENGRDQVVYC
ncbi:GGDEF domain-containing protein [Psychrosphaera sp. 1_MG-2023]|uniref:GGDEF domain-containing protein n=1 Tax=Psychrosphaera sp. 1_MG-2023 TaxID=3062643 RepID=UPI0026E425D2|nr:GGDEF domain-containing protein [Psychrosphaera sp. 1_MG-2023]MDO6718912.1 GGDEF domain-containing protein [Psychrosphaera sp. 1_MG-2023]